MKSIAILCTSYSSNPWNSQGRTSNNLAHSLARKGYSVDVYSYANLPETFSKQDGQITVTYVSDETNRQSLDVRNVTKWNSRLLAQIKDRAYTRLIFTDTKTWPTVAEYKKQHPHVKTINYVSVLHSLSGWIVPVSLDAKKEITDREYASLYGADVLLAHTMRYASKVADMAKREVYVVPNFDTKRYTIKRNPSKDVCYIGKLNRERNLETLLRAVAKIPDIKLTMVCPKEALAYNEMLNILAKRLRIEDRVLYKFGHTLTEIEETYANSSCAVVPSLVEGYGYGAIDPINTRTPVLVSEWSTLKDYLSDEGSVFDSVATLERAISDIVNYPDYAEAIATNNLAHMEASYSERVATSMLEHIL